MNFIFECSTRYLTSECSKQVRYRVEHEKIEFKSTSRHVIFCLLYKHRINSSEKGAIYYVTITTVISSRVKITCYLHTWRYEVFAGKLTWYFTGVYVINTYITCNMSSFPVSKVCCKHNVLLPYQTKFKNKFKLEVYMTWEIIILLLTFWKAFQNTRECYFSFWNFFFRFRDIDVCLLDNLGRDDVFFVSFVINISGAKFEEHCFNISRDIIQYFTMICELFFCKKIPLSWVCYGRVNGSVSQWVRDVCMSHQSDRIYYKQPIKFLILKANGIWEDLIPIQFRTAIFILL